MKKIIGFITIVMMVLIGVIACDTEHSGSAEGNVSKTPTTIKGNENNSSSSQSGDDNSSLPSNQSGDDSSSSSSDSSSSDDSSSSSQSGDNSSSSASDSSSSGDSSSSSSQSGDDSSSSASNSASSEDSSSSSSQEPVIIQYTVIFDANGGTGTMANQTFIYDETQDLNNCSFTPPTGHQFGGWNTADDGQGDTFANSAVVKNLTSVNNGSVTLYAQWTANQYQIIYKDKNNLAFSGTHGANYPTVYTYDQSAALDTPHRDGYEFAWYHLRSDCSDDAITALAASTYTDDITLYAQWILGNGIITVVTPTYQDVDNLLTYSDNTFTALSGYQTYIWYIDSTKQSNSTSTLTLDTSSLSAGNHTVTVMVTDSQGGAYSAEMTFQVKKSY